VYLLILAFCILMLVWAIPTYTPPYPGYGASPALVSHVSIGIMVVMSVLVLTRNVITFFLAKPLPPGEGAFPEDGKATGFTQAGRVKLAHLIKFIGSCALLIIGIEFIGYIPSAFLFLLLIQFIIGSRNPVQMIAVSVAAVTVMYVIMRYGFGVPIPGPQLF